MTVLTFPSVIPVSASWMPRANSQSFTSPLTRATQTKELAGMRWTASLRFRGLVDGEAAAMAAFLAQLRGEAGRFRVYNHSRPAPRGIATGTPLVADPGATIAIGDNSIPTDGWTVSQTGILLVGDMFMVNDELKIITADADSDAGGNATLTFEPPLRAAPADNAAINLGTGATAIMKLVDDSQAGWAARSPLFHDFSLDIEEAFFS